MNTPENRPSSALAPLARAWAALVALTLASLLLRRWFHGAEWLPLLVAALLWVKGSIVAWRFIETDIAHPFIRRVVAVFVAFAPVAVLVIGFFGGAVARWATL